MEKEISRLDYFAGLAMPIMYGMYADEPEALPKVIAEESYHLASAMVAESDRIKKAQKKGSANGKV